MQNKTTKLDFLIKNAKKKNFSRLFFQIGFQFF